MIVPRRGEKVETALSCHDQLGILALWARYNITAVGCWWILGLESSGQVIRPRRSHGYGDCVQTSAVGAGHLQEALKANDPNILRYSIALLT